ncbi:MAG: hypothetical protein IT534_11475 [Bauldia sp.]|jgi:hypothetical protein|nr:hypothetical protein [Bauldia sp.]
MVQATGSPARPRVWRAIGTGAFYAVAGSILGAIVLVILGSILDWPTTTLEPPAAFIVIAFVSGVLPLFVAGFSVGWTQPAGFARRAGLSVLVALVVGGVWGLAAAGSHAESAIVGVAEVGLGNAVAALFAAVVLSLFTGRASAARRGATA